MNHLSTFVLLAVGAFAAQDPAVPEPKQVTYAVIVNDNNSTKEEGDAAKKLVKSLFLKDLTRWPDGSLAKPYDREPNSPEHVAFLREVLAMSEAEVARHWLRAKNMNGTTPPREVDTDSMLQKHIARHDGAFGIVKLDAAKAPGVRILFEFRAPQ
ncbi:MAG TPA: hypothetical protein VFZ65_01140 [Planctomycetota bacterium]|nr:hypothetical protein [Planctomycetota bacterium]